MFYFIKMTTIEPLTRDELGEIERVILSFTDLRAVPVSIGGMIGRLIETFRDLVKDPSVCFTSVHEQGLVPLYYNKKGNRVHAHITTGGLFARYTPAFGQNIISALRDIVRFPKIKELHDLVIEFDAKLNELSAANASGQKYLEGVSKELM